jgi:hypothetical protein
LGLHFLSKQSINCPSFFATTTSQPCLNLNPHSCINWPPIMNTMPMLRNWASLITFTSFSYTKTTQRGPFILIPSIIERNLEIWIYHYFPKTDLCYANNIVLLKPIKMAAIWIGDDLGYLTFSMIINSFGFKVASS